MKNKIMYVVGVDEAGRGPLAGPVAVAAAVIPMHFSWRKIPGVTDSKLLTEARRERIFHIAQMLKKNKKIDYAVTLVGPECVDRKGVGHSVSLGINRCLRRLALEPECTRVLLDGLLFAPQRFSHQQTIVQGDQKEKAIGLASIIAKVTRDRYMVNISREYPSYEFYAHKGYGTRAHRMLIQKHGVSRMHRKTYCKNLLV